MFFFLFLTTSTAVVTADPFHFAKSFPPFGLPVITPSAEKELELEKITAALGLEKKELSLPWMEKEFTFDKGIGVGIGIGKELELEKEFSVGKLAGLEKWFGVEKASPGWLYEKYFGLGKKLSFEQALIFELYKQYGYYGLWVAKELQRRHLIAQELGLIGKEIAIQEAISLGLFKGIGLDKIFESVNKAIGVEKAFEFEKGFGIFKKF